MRDRRRLQGAAGWLAGGATSLARAAELIKTAPRTTEPMRIPTHPFRHRRSGLRAADHPANARGIRPQRFAKAAFVAPVLWSRFGINDVNWKAANKVAVYPGLNLAYNRIKKNANTTVAILLREMESGVREGGGAAKDNSFNLRTIPLSAICNVRRFCFFVVVRNPYSRVLSAFLNKFQHHSYRKMYGTFDLTPDGFAAFVVWLRHGGLNKDRHWDLQTKLTFLPIEKYDAVVRLENFDIEMHSLLESNDLRPPEGRLKGRYPSANSRLQEFYNPGLVSLVAELYGKDFDELGYSRAFPAWSGHLDRHRGPG